MPANKYINWFEIYNNPALFHIYLTERKRGKTDTKAWSFLENIITNSNKYVWLRRHWHDSLECSKPYWQDLVYKFCEEKGIKNNSFEIQEQGLFYLGKRRIYFFDLFSFRKARGKIARGTNFQEIVFEEAIPIDQEFLPQEQWKFKDLVESLKRQEQPLKITFLANPYIWSSWFLDNIPNLQNSRKESQELVDKGQNDGVKVESKDGQWLLYLNLLKGTEDPHSLALEEKINPSLRNWDDFMLDEPGKYRILHSIQDYFFCEIGKRVKNKKYMLVHFTKNKKETDSNLINYCFDLQEQAKSKLKNCVIREKLALISKWVKMLKNGMLYFRDYKSRDWFLEQLKVKHGK
ncbi:MAG: hypothetical protein MRERV_8c061 [Mycoplasmataceae bacterium RV_VA103A]|nr:MAG: hypothetical protein MRERV_8c061 [Mycoplasmataceae bacterium RV_VA103A]